MCLRELGLGYDGEENIVDLSLLTSDYMAQDGDVLTGTLKSEVMISVADSATITLKDCHIREKTFQHPVITCLGSAEIITSGTSILGGIPDPYFKRLFMTTEDQNAEIVHDLINRVVPRYEVIDFYTLMDFLAFFLTSLDDDVNEVKRGVRYIVGYQAACIIPQADIKITQ
jgi:hypothetical protein